MRSPKIGKVFLKHILFIKTVTFSAGGYFNGLDVTTVQFQANKTIYTMEHQFPSDGLAPVSQEGMPKGQFLEEIQGLHIENWKKDYDDPTIMDGEQWSLTIEFSDGYSPVEISGSNAYPPQFNSLRQLMTFSHSAEKGVDMYG